MHKPDDTAASLFSMDLQSLLKIKVTTASKFEEDLSAAPGVISVVTRDELARFGGFSVKQLLERVPGLFVSSDSFTDRSMISIRGEQTRSNSNHVLFLINGRPTREVLEGGIATDLLESFPVSALERIEVIKGPGSVLYGSNAFSGVVNLITRQAEGNNLEIAESSAGGTASSTSGRFSLQRGDLRIFGAGQYHALPNWPVHYVSSVFGNSDVVVPSKSDGAYLDLSYGHLRLMSAWDEYRTSYVEGWAGQALWRRGFADAGYSVRVRPHWDMSLDLTFTRTALEDASYFPNISRDSHELVAEWTNTVSVGNRDRLIFGYAFNHMSGIQRLHTPPFGANVDGTQSGNAIYAQLQHRLTASLMLVGGLQGNKVGNLRFDLVPRAGLIWSPSSAWTAKALYSEAFHAPMLHETLLDFTPAPGIMAPALKGDPNLRAEKIATIDLALSYRKERFEATLDYFHSHLNNRIVMGPDGGGFNWSYSNQGAVVLHGLELEGKYYAGEHLFLTASGIGQRSHDAKGTPNVSPVAPFAAKAGVGYEVRHRLTAAVFDVEQGSVPGGGAAENPKPTAQHLLSANLRLEMAPWLHDAFSRRVALVAYGDNLANRPVWLPNIPDAPGDTIFARRGRTINVGLEFGFGKD